MAVPFDANVHEKVSTSTSPYLRNVVRETNFASKINDALNTPNTKHAWDLVGSVPVAGGVKSLPANAVIMPGGGKFVIDPTGRLDIAGKGLHNPLANVPVFEGATAKTIIMYDDSATGRYPSLEHGGVGYFPYNNSGMVNGRRVLYWTKGTPFGGLTNFTFYKIVQASSTGFKIAAVSDTTNTPIVYSIPSGGTGIHFFVDANVNFTGAARPLAINSELFDTSNASFNDRLKAADAAISGRTGKIVVEPRGLDSSNAYLTSKHSLEFSAGDYPNAYDGDVNFAPVVFLPDTQIEGSGIVNLYESGVYSGTTKPRVLRCFDLHKDMGRVVIKNLNFTFTTDFANSGNQSTVCVGNASSGYAENLYFNHCTGYCFQIGGSGHEGVRATDFHLRNTYFRNCPNQPLFVSNALRTTLSRLKFFHDDSRYLPNGAADFEPNDPSDLIEDVTFENCEWDYHVSYLAGYSSVMGAAIIFNSVNTKGITKVSVSKCRFKAPTGYVFDWISATGVSDITVDGCTFEGNDWRPFTMVNCSGVTISNNDLTRIGVILPDNPVAMLVAGCPDALVYNNKFPEDEGADNYSKVIQEYELEVYVDSVSGSTVSVGITPSGIQNSQGEAVCPYPNVWKHQKFELNMQTWQVTASNAATRIITVDRALPTGYGQKTFAGSAINTSNGRINIPNHKFVTGDIVAFVAQTFGGSPMTGETYASGGVNGQPMPAHVQPQRYPVPRQDAPPTYFIIRIDDNYVQLAATRENALASSPVFIPFTGQGTGNYRLIPKLRTKFLNTQFSNNHRAQYWLDPNGNSKILSRTDGSQEAMVVFTSPSVDVNLKESDTGLVYTDLNKTGVLQANLPDKPRDGLKYTFVVANGGIKIVCNAKSKIYYQGGVTPFFGQIESTAKAAKITLVSLNGYWQAFEQHGVWTGGAYNNSPYNVNFAAASAGASASASTDSVSFPAANANNGLRTGGFWSSANVGTDGSGNLNTPQWLAVDFGQARTISEIKIYSFDDTGGATEATDTSEATSFGLVNFDVQTWNGSSWVTIPSVGAKTGETKAISKIEFSAITTEKIRVYITKTRDYAARALEVEAYNRAP